MRRTRTVVGALLSVLLVACTAAPSVTPAPSSAPAAPSAPLASPTGSPAVSRGPPLGSPAEPPATTQPSFALAGPTESTPSESPETLPPAAADLIEAAVADGRIDAPTALLYRMFAWVGDPRLPAEFAGTTDAEDLVPFTVAADPEVQLPDDIRAQLEPYLLRPSNPKSAFFGGDATTGANGTTGSTNVIQTAAKVDPPPVAVVPCGNGWKSQQASVPVRIWARCGGDDDDILTGIIEVELLFGPMTAYMHRLPVPDKGGQPDDPDPMLDIYLTGDGACPPEGTRCFVLQDNWGGFASPVGTGSDAGSSSGYIAIRRLYVSGDPARFRRVLIHELFHILEFARSTSFMVGPAGTDAVGNPVYDDFWFVEASAVWAEYHFEAQAGNTVSAENVAPEWFIGDFQRSDVSLDALVPRYHRYGAYIWPFFMNQERGKAAISDVWEALGYQTSDWAAAMAIIDSFQSFHDTFHTFAVRNINYNLAGSGNPDPIKKRYQALDPGVDFPDGHPQTSNWRGTDIIVPTAQPKEFSDTIQPLSAHYWQVPIGDEVQRFEFDFSGLGDDASLDVDAVIGLRTAGKGSPLKWVERPLSHPKAKFCRSVPEEDVGEMYLVLSNHEMQPLPLKGHFTVKASRDPCIGFAVTIVHETTGGPFDPSKVTLTAVIESDQDGAADGELTGTGDASGTYLVADPVNGGCRSETLTGGSDMSGSVEGDLLTVVAFATGGPVEIYGGSASTKGGTTKSERAPLLQPGQPPLDMMRCDDWSLLTDTVTVSPLGSSPGTGPGAFAP